MKSARSTTRVLVALTAVALFGCPNSPPPPPGECESECENGSACSQAAQCTSGFCVDGVCCEAACGGSCESCDSAGACVAAAAGTDPDGDCEAEAVTTCGRTGECGPDRACALRPATTECGARSCATAGSSTRAPLCDGAGACVAAGVEDCAPWVCDPATGACRTTCSGEADCEANAECISGTCKRVNGGLCNTGTQCVSGFCVDGTCCEGECAATCESCNQVGTEGVCTPLPAGTDPANECANTPPETCGTVGDCSGEAHCTFHPAGTACGTAECDGSIFHGAESCDGLGACVEPTPQPCTPYACAPEGCATTCSDDTACTPGNTCCSPSCVDLAGDVNHCGACTTACVNPGGATQCLEGQCSPACDNGWMNCNGNAVDGCEVRLSGASNTPPGENLGSWAGDRESGFFCTSDSCAQRADRVGLGGYFARFTVTEESSCNASVVGRVVLVVPDDADYDLYVTSLKGDCTGGCVSATRGGGDEAITVINHDSGGSTDSNIINVEVRWYSGSTCAKWHLYVYSRNC